MSRSRAVRRTACWLLAATLAAGAAAGAAGPRFAGRPLAEALALLQREGLPLVFTSELVTPVMRVEREPESSDPRAQLDELLAPFGLAVDASTPGLLVVIAGHGAPPAPAPAATPPPLAIVREELEVRPSRLPLLASAGDPSTIALDRQAIDRLPQLGGDLLRAATLLPGIAANDVSAALAVRGGRPDELAVVLDGQELYGAYHLEDYDNALSVVPARLLGSASLTTGALPASQGDRMGGMLDLRTVDAPASARQMLGVSVLDVFASASDRLGDDGGWLITGRRGSLALATRAIGDEHPQFWDLLGKVEGTTRLGHLALHALAAGDHLRVETRDEDFFEHLRNDYRSDYGWLTHEAGSARLLVQTLLSWARLEHDRSDVSREEKGTFAIRDERDLDVLAATQTWSVPLGAHTLEAGWEAQRYDLDYDYAQQRRPLIVLRGPFMVVRPPQQAARGALRDDHGGLWLRDVAALGDRLTVDAGCRFDTHTATDDDLASPRLSLAWRAAESAVLRLAWGRFVQSQRVYELEVTDGQTALHPAERSDQWVLGWEWAGGAEAPLSGARVELYHRVVADPRPRFESLLEPINFFPETEPDRARIVADRGVASGVEVLLRGRRSARGDWWVAYSLARAVDELGSRDAPRPFDQRHTLTANLARALPRGWQIDLAWRWHSGWPTTPVTPGPVVRGVSFGDVGALESDRFPAYHRLDLRATRQWALAHGALTFFVDVQNVYARRNVAGFDSVPDEETGRLSFEPEYWPGIVPSFGITWEHGGR